MRSSYVPPLRDVMVRGATVARAVIARRQAPSFAVVASASSHLLLAFLLQGASPSLERSEPPPAVFELVAPPPPAEVTAPEPAPLEPAPPPELDAPRPEIQTPRVPDTQPASSEPPPPEDDPYAGAPPPAVLDGPPADGPAPAAILTGGQGAGWAAPTGAGKGGAGRAREVAAPRAPSASRRAPGVPIVAISDLSRPPAPPSLDAALRRLYPEDARREGRSGDATVRARIGPSGAVVEMRVVRATDPAFGGACRALLAPSRWSAPLDRDGAAVSTWIKYTCRFNAER